jgi:alpha-mannosidase
MPYPAAEFDKAWQSKIYPDHGWGGHDGDITDDLFKAKLVESRMLGKELLTKGTDFIASKIKTKDKLGIPVVLFNSLSWKRTDPVTVSVNLQKAQAKSLSIITSDKHTIASQITKIDYHDDGSIKSADLVFIAKDIPAIGYRTYYIKQSQNNMKKDLQPASLSAYENDFYTISFGKGGISQIYDKELKRNLFKTEKFKGAEVFTMQSIGNGAGEFGDVQQPFMQDFDKVSLHDPEWKIIESGNVFTTYRLKQNILYATVEQDVTIYHELKRVLFETKLLNWSGELYREFRTAFPMDMKNATVAYEVPFGTVKVGQDEIKTAGDRYTPLCKDVHPRAILDWISVSDSEISVTLSSSVAAADWIDPTSQNENIVLQHLLLASRTSVHWEGNRYSQEGNHYYNNILTSNKTGDIAGMRIAKQQNDPLQVKIYPNRSNDATLPESASFFNIDKENVIITTIKKAEDTDNLIIRMYDAEGKNARVNLNSFFNIDKVQQTNIIEENPQPVQELNISKYAIETFSFEAKK